MKSKEIEGKSQLIGTATSKSINSENRLKFLNDETKRKAHKQLGNFMARFYNNTTVKCFSIWKRINLLHKQREKLVKLTIKHWQKYQMTVVRGAFKSFVTVEVQKIKKQAIRQVVAEGDV